MESIVMKENKVNSQVKKVSKNRSKIVPLYKDSKELFDRYKRSITIPKQESFERIFEVQKKYLNNSYWGFSKRLFDIVVSVLVMIFVLLWMYPLFFVIIKLGSKGPVIFKQKRNGLHMKPFDCYKFRSMEINEFCDTVPVTKDDPRITKFGKFLRKNSLDELPQFINVLKGEMTIVGPRPHMLNESNSFAKISQDFHKRHHVKPGITGLAQINNCRGYIGNLSDLSNRIKYDLFYIRNASLGYDLIIVYKTIIQMLFKHSSKFK